MRNLKNIKNKETKKHTFFNKFFLGRSKDYIIENLTLLVDSGMGILSALESMADGTNSKRIKKIIGQIKLDVDSGSPLWEALSFSAIFPDKVISLIKIGERSGRLTSNLKVISEQQQKERLFNSKIKGALMYPFFVIIVAFIVAVGIAWFILPKLAMVFVSLRIKLPLITKILISFGGFLGEYGAVAVPAMIVCFMVGVYIIFFLKYTKNTGQFIVFRLPIFEKIIQQMELSRFGYLLGSLLEAGMPIVDSIRSIKETADFYFYKKFYTYLERSIEDGNSFQKSFLGYKKISKLFPSPIQQMIINSEKSGHLSETFKKIGNVFEEKLENTTKNLAVILEPVLLVIVWLGVVAVALAVILPIYGLIGGLQ